jgi:hypothetical protein
MGEAVLRGDDIYAPRVFFPYLPYSQVVPAACLWLSRISGLPFHLAMKLPNLLSDALAAAFLFLALARRGSPRRAFAWTMAFALNPVSILVSAVHGNLMGLVASTIAIAFALGMRAEDAGLETPDGRMWAAAAALVLGCAVALRSFPVLLVPAFAAWLATSARRVVGLAALASIASTASALPYLFLAREGFLREVLGYSGLADFGWLAVLRAIPLVFEDRKLFEFGARFLAPSKIVFLVACVATWTRLPALPPSARLRHALLPPLLFYALYGGVAAQYLVWIVPTAALLEERLLPAWSAVATAALLAFYRIYHPGILTRGAPPAPDGLAVHVLLLVANVAFVALSLIWAGKILFAERRT